VITADRQTEATEFGPAGLLLNIRRARPGVAYSVECGCERVVLPSLPAGRGPFVYHDGTVESVASPSAVAAAKVRAKLEADAARALAETETDPSVHAALLEIAKGISP